MVDKLMIIAHPDDEIVFGGAHLIQGHNWMVVCVTNANNKVRRREFVHVMRRLGVKYEIWNYKDTYSYRFNKLGLKRDLQRLIRRKQFKQIVTHGLRGEYGHPQHIVIARILAKLVANNLYVFSMGQKRLPKRILFKKKMLLNLYKSQRRNLRQLCRDDALHLYINRERFIRVK